MANRSCCTCHVSRESVIQPMLSWQPVREPDHRLHSKYSTVLRVPVEYNAALPHCTLGSFEVQSYSRTESLNIISQAF